MITDNEKIEILINKLNNLELIKQSFIDHAEEFKDKYSLEDELLECSVKKNVLLGALEDLGGAWPETLD
jgi:hypothetical protein